MASVVPILKKQAKRTPRPKLVYQFLVVLSGTDPLVWRRIQVPEKYSFWDLHVAIQARVRTLCRLFGVSPSGFYASQTRPESPRAREDRRLKVLLHASFTGGRGYYGSPRIHDDFIEWGEHVSRKRIIRLKQEEGLYARGCASGIRSRPTATTISPSLTTCCSRILRRPVRINGGSETRVNYASASRARRIWP